MRMELVGINRRYATLAVLLLITVWCWLVFDRPYTFPRHIPWNIYSNTPQIAVDVFNFPALDSPAIKAVCSNTQWNQTVTFVCDKSSGSFVEVRNSILHCVRYAMAAGGSLVVPMIVVAHEQGYMYKDDRTGNTTELDYMFDTEHFLDSLALSCPQLQVYKRVTDINMKDVYGPISLLPENILKNAEDSRIGPVEWRELFYKWLMQYLSPDSRSPVIIQLERSYLEYPISSDGESFAADFGKILKIRPDARNLATTALLKLSQLYSLSVDVTQPILKGTFLGAYLSTEVRGLELLKDDRVNARYDAQSKLYLDQAVQSNLSIIYLASEKMSEISQFVNDAASQKIAVTTKMDLLKGEDREYLLHELTVDQQALVDYLVMSKSSDFVGVAHSNFAWNVALKRHQFTERLDYLDGPETFDDGLSQIYGTVRGHPESPGAMWP
jgi:hypothetical protein